MSASYRNSWMWAEACALLDEAERRHRHFYQLMTAPAARPVWEPPVNVLADGATVQVTVALPGARADDVHVHLTESGLHVETTVAPPGLPAGVNFVRLEIPYGRMRRLIELPPGRYALLDRRLEHGCLLLTLRGAP
jgi:HSP20 family molecular chaperone IbpA